jgi:hypothetical protein
MNRRQKTKIQAEKAVGRKLRPFLATYLRVTQQTDRLIYQLLASRENRPTNAKAPVVCAILLARLSNDLRACSLFASRGHILQSWTIGASALESAYSVGFVGADEQRAKRWFDHNDLQKPAWPVFDALASTLRTFDLLSNLENFFGSYRRLSAAKHGNPLIQSRYGISRSGLATRIQVDPYFGKGAAAAARYGIAWTLHGAGLGMWSYAHHYSPGKSLERSVVHFAQQTYSLAAAARDV